MNASDWLALAGIGISAATLAVVGFGAVWLQYYLENLRLKREVFRRVVGSIHGILYDCQVFKASHSFSESGIVAINEVRAVFRSRSVLSAWERWHSLTLSNEDPNRSFVELIREMSGECRLKQYRIMSV